MTDRLTFSVIIPTYNRHSSLHACFQSLSQQKYPESDFEIIVVDDGSVPPIRDSIRTEFPGMNVSLLRSPQNEGPAAARNRGAKIARGQYLAFTDDDCLPDANWLAELKCVLTTISANAAGGRIIDGSGSLYSAASHAILDAAYEYYSASADGPRFLASQNFIVAAKEFRELGGFLPDFRTSEDREFCDRWLRQGNKLAFAPKAVVTHQSPPGLGRFLRRHYHYGRGAYRFRALQARIEKRRLELEPLIFYRKLICRSLSKQAGMRGIAISFLIAVSQASSLLGFLTERWNGKRFGR